MSKEDYDPQHPLGYGSEQSCQYYKVNTEIASQCFIKCSSTFGKQLDKNFYAIRQFRARLITPTQNSPKSQTLNQISQYFPKIPFLIYSIFNTSSLE